MFVQQVDLSTGKGVVRGARRGIAALAVDPWSDLDCVRVGGGVLRPTGLIQVAEGGVFPGSVNLEAVRNTSGLDRRECSQILLQVFEPGDIILPPPKRVSKVYEFLTLSLTAATAAFVGAVPFTGRRAVKVSVRGPSGSICTTRVIGRFIASGTLDFAQELGADTFTTSAASAQWVGSGVAGKLQTQSRYEGGTDSLEMWDELHIMANSDTTGTHHVVVEVADEVNG